MKVSSGASLAAKPFLPKRWIAIVVVLSAAVGTIATLYGGYLNRHGGRATEGKILGGWLLAIAAPALVMTTQLFTGRRAAHPVPSDRSNPAAVTEPGWTAQVIRPAVGLLSAGAALIHFAVIGEHYDESWVAGLFFLGLSVFQLLWGLALVVRPVRWLLAAGIIVNILTVAVWAVSRTIALPFGPEAGEAIEPGFGDVVATAFEVLIIGGCAVLWPARRQMTDGSRRRLRLPTASSANTIITLLITALTALAMISAVGGSIFVPPAG